VEGREVVARMRALEGDVSNEMGEDAPAIDRCIATWAGVDYEGLDKVIAGEIRRTLRLAGGTHYQSHGFAMTPENVASLGFLQGVTFATAAARLERERAERASQDD
jgi:hypothetical protein